MLLALRAIAGPLSRVQGYVEGSPTGLLAAFAMPARAQGETFAPRLAVPSDSPGQAVDRREQVKRDIGGLIVRRVRVRDVVDEGTQRRGPRRRRERFALRAVRHR